jgi:hypothetical protein
MVQLPERWLTGSMLRNAWKVSASWMLLLAMVHIYWGFGGAGLLPDGVSVLDSRGLFVIDLVVIPLLLAGAGTAWLLRPTQRAGKLRARAWLLWPATLGCAVMFGHVLSTALFGVPGVLADRGAAGSRWAYQLAFEPVWLLGAVAMLATVVAFRRAAWSGTQLSTRPPASSPSRRPSSVSR